MESSIECSINNRRQAQGYKSIDLRNFFRAIMNYYCISGAENMSKYK